MSAEYLARMDPDAFSRNWHGLLSGENNSIAVRVGVDRQGRVVGFASAAPIREAGGPARQELYAINVLAGAHGTGVAHLLLEAVVGPEPCSPWVAVGNERAEAFYLRYGFVEDGATTTDERSGAVEKRMVRLSASS